MGLYYMVAFNCESGEAMVLMLQPAEIEKPASVLAHSLPAPIDIISPGLFEEL